MLARLSNGFALARCAWHAIMADKKLLVFPLVSGLLVLLILIGFAVPLGMLFKEGNLYNAEGKLRVWNYPIFFALYFLCYSVVIFCNAALVSCAVLRFNGDSATVGDGFRAAFARKRQILGWAAVSASVGVLLMLIESAGRRFGQIVARVLGAAWSVMTFFVVPVLVVENSGPFHAIRESASLLKRTWGEAAAGKAGLGLFFLLLFLPVGAAFALGIYLLPKDHPAALGAFAAGGVLVIGFLVICSAMTNVFLAAVYQFARFGRVPDGFDRDRIAAAFAPVKS